MNYTGYVFLTTTYSGRVPLCIATLSGVMTQVSGAHFVIQWCDEAPPNYLRYVVSMIASHTRNTFEVNQMPSDLSVAHTKLAFNLPDSATHFVNLDDDLLVTPQSLRLLLGCRNTPVVSIGVMDANNSRGFSDYDEVRYESFIEFQRHHPPGKAKHHTFKHASIITGYKWISQLYCLRRDVYLDPATWAEIKEVFTKKGIRGYDIVLENQLASTGLDIALIVGCEALHIGLEHAYIGGPWKGANPIATTVVKTENGYAIDS